jgi:hypothetical protein
MAASEPTACTAFSAVCFNAGSEFAGSQPVESATMSVAAPRRREVILVIEAAGQGLLTTEQRTDCCD